MEDVCRICLISSSNLIPMAEEIEKDEFEVLDNGHKFELHLNIKLEDLPLCYNICGYCNNLLKEFHDFKILALESHRKLKKLQESKNIHIKVEKKEIPYEVEKLKEDLSSDTDQNESQLNSNADTFFEDNIITDEYEESVVPEDNFDNEIIQEDNLATEDNQSSELKNNDEQVLIEYLSFEDYLDDLLAASTIKTQRDENNEETEGSTTSSKKDISNIQAEIHELNNSGIDDNCSQIEAISLNPNIRKERKKSVTYAYNCSFCKKKFTNEISHEAHENVHKGLPAYRCKVCNKILKSKKTFDYHMLWHNNIRPYQCTVCSQRFIEKGDLRIHMRKHTGVKPFICHICGRQFAIRVHLTYHLETHEPQNKYECPHCKNRYRTKPILNIHISTVHKKDREYVCTICGKIFYRRYYLAVHMRMHQKRENKT